jgi:putative acetyltransferase
MRDIRGLGLGGRLLRIALSHAERFGFRLCYLETLADMKAAQELYSRYGFRQLNAPRGHTGHTVCTVWMEKTLGER